MTNLQRLGTTIILVLIGFGINHMLPQDLYAKMDKPTIIAEDFYRYILSKRYEDAAELLSKNDKRNFRQLKTKLAQTGKGNSSNYELSTLIENQFFLVHGQTNKKMKGKSGDGETILPSKVSYYVPGQYYVVGNFAVVFTRETYDIEQDKTGPVRDDPRKLWIDPTNDLSKIRDEAYFKRWWVWEDNQLTMPGVIWLIKDRQEWRIDLISGSVPKKAFRGILKWHFGRDIFDNSSSKEKSSAPKKPTAKPKSSSTKSKK